ncbi:ABC transporter ATP-binding protein [Bordetella flabilis]|uniref:ABC transporter ATP-binding protein n=1 Tax=Bordetella flabilis TaxID=463014 RepID=A0A193GDN8_9BORD|nr:ABC transporter ATP-binding protein [Bordetella flabilis]ANN77930.1 ABC transporter ATP-binding protein [Bordetella flabilis]
MLELRDVHVHYGLSHVLQGLTLEVGPGEVVGLFGRNGVGKTTTIKTVAGWTAPSSGEIRFRGESLASLPAEKICRRGIGLVPEDRRIFPGLTTEENLAMGFMQRPRLGRVEERGRLERIYERFPRLAERRAQPGTTLSGGEQQMLAIARVLLGQPDLLLIDEPTEGLAPLIINDLFDVMAQVKAAGQSILLVEQNVPRALTLCDRFYALERGQVVMSGRTDRPEDVQALMQAIAV